MSSPAEQMDSPDAVLVKQSCKCRNCGWEIERFYCPNCGQHNANHNAGVWLFLQEFLEEFIRFDSKLLRTLIPLIAKPGFLTKEWATGKRVRYISPLKLYITVSALGFLALSMKANSSAAQYASTVKAVSHGGSAIPPQGKLDAVINRLVPHLPQFDPSTFRSHFFTHLPTASLVLIPITGLVFWALYFRQKLYYVEHLVFTLHFNAFGFATLGIASLFNSEIPSLVAFFWAIGYLLFAMKANYGQGWATTLFKFTLFSAVYFGLVLIATLATVEVSAYMASMSGGSFGSQMSHGDHLSSHPPH